MKHSRIVVILLFISTWCHAQRNGQQEENIEQLVQEVLVQSAVSDNYEEAFDALYQRFLSPLNINQASDEELEGLYILSETEIRAIQRHKERYGDFIAIEELQSVEGLEISTVKRLSYFIEVRAVFRIQNFKRKLLDNPQQFLLYRTDTQWPFKAGYKKDYRGNAAYEGAPVRQLMRYRNSVSKEYSVGFTLEKDRGEPIRWDPSHKLYGIDFYSFHFALFQKKRIQALCLGDYKLQFGQGLVFGGGFSMGKGAETIISTKKNYNGVVPYTSLVEGTYFRGGCVSYLMHPQVVLTAMGSSILKDASLAIDSMNHTTTIRSFSTTGYHRTDYELKQKKQVRETVLGGTMLVSSKNKKSGLGISYVATSFDKAVQEPDRIYNRFDFQGKVNRVVGIAASSRFRNGILFGEVAHSTGNGNAVVIGTIVSLSSKLDISYLYRNYGKNFHSFYSNSFSEGGVSNNEKGNYWGAKLALTKKWQLTGYYDWFEFPWLKYFKDSPTNGYGYLGKLSFTPSKKILLYLQYKEEHFGKNQSDNFTPVDFTVPSHKLNGVVNLDYKTDHLFFRCRYQWSRYKQSNGATKGMVVVQELVGNIRKAKVGIQYALFDVEDFDNRQYVYEKDVLYSVSFPAYLGTGTRICLLWQVQLSKKLDIWIRYAQTSYLHKTSIGTGLEEIQGNTLKEARLQLRYLFNR